MPHSTITDENGVTTQLEWQSAPMVSQMAWGDALDSCRALRALTTSDHTNWRLPTRKEVISLIENNMMQQLDAMERGLEFTGFNLSGKLIWTRDSVAEQSNKAYIVDQNGNCSVVNKEELRDVIAVTICSH